MFTDKKQTKKQGQIQAQRNLIGATTTIIGDFISEGDFRIDGKLEGNVKTSGRVVIGKDGAIKGMIECANADIEGSFSGKLSCTGTLTLKASADISGEVFIEKLSVEPGATFNAACNMKGIKALNKKDSNREAEKSIS